MKSKEKIFREFCAWGWLICWLVAIWAPSPYGHKLFWTGSFLLLGGNEACLLGEMMQRIINLK